MHPLSYCDALGSESKAALEVGAGVLTFEIILKAQCPSLAVSWETELSGPVTEPQPHMAPPLAHHMSQLGRASPASSSHLSLLLWTDYTP